MIICRLLGSADPKAACLLPTPNRSLAAQNGAVRLRAPVKSARTAGMGAFWSKYIHILDGCFPNSAAQKQSDRKPPEATTGRNLSEWLFCPALLPSRSGFCCGTRRTAASENAPTQHIWRSSGGNWPKPTAKTRPGPLLKTDAKDRKGGVAHDRPKRERSEKS